VINAGCDKRDAGNSMNKSPHRISKPDHVGDCGKGINQSKPGKNQNREGSKKDPVLDSLIQCHAHNRGVLQLPPRNCFAPPDDQVVQ
jgi:hypothetical protein